jgi:NAD-dependent deacetylase
MVIDEVEAAQNQLRPLIAAATSIVGFTGAGISTECGVPDFRSPDSAWRRHPPIDFKDFLASAEARIEAWRRKFAMDDIYAGARPGRTHHALAHLARGGRLSCVVTQNIDGLHQAAGLPDEQLLELHGNGTYARCLACGTRHELADIRRRLEATGEAPACEACGGMVKSATVAFGQALSPDILRASRQATLAADLYLVLGSSLVVRPAAALPLLAKQNGAVLVIVNRDLTPLDAVADLVIRADVGGVLEEWAPTI